MSSPSRPGAPRSSERGAPGGAPRGEQGGARGQAPRSVPRAVPRPAQRSATRAPRGAGLRVGPPARPGETTASGSLPTQRRAVEPAPVRGSLAAVLSWRGLVLAGVVGLAFALVWPSVRVYLDQREQVAALQAERDAAAAEVADLDADLARWEDPAFVVAQARERLAYVFPGETPYRVVDPEVALPAADGSYDAATAAEGRDEAAWYDRLWESIEEAGGAGVSGEPAP